MSKFILEKSKNTPAVYLDIEFPKFEIKGSSYAESVAEIYEQIKQWMQDELDKLEKNLVCEFHFGIVNSVSLKNILQIITGLSNFGKKGNQITVKWFYDDYDEDILEAGEDLSKLSGLEFEFISVGVGNNEKLEEDLNLNLNDL